MTRATGSGDAGPRAHAFRPWLRAVAVWALGGAGAVGVYLWLDAAFDAGLLGLLVGFLTFSLAGDLLLAWQNERATDRGHTDQRNDVRGRRAVAVDTFRPAEDGNFRGRVRLGGERWNARAQAGGVEAGVTVVVVGRDRLTLLVEPLASGRDAS